MQQRAVMCGVESDPVTPTPIIVRRLLLQFKIFISLNTKEEKKKKKDQNQLHGRCWKVVLVPKVFIVFDDATGHVQEGLALEFSCHSMYPRPAMC